MREVTTQKSLENISGLVIVAISHDPYRDQTYALACLARRSDIIRPTDGSRGSGPNWVRWSGAPSCAVGNASPAQSRAEQRVLAQADAIEQLAIRIDATVDTLRLDDTRGHEGLMDSVLVRPMPGLEAQLADRVQIDWWYDEGGVGPLRKAGTLYARACDPKQAK